MKTLLALLIVLAVMPNIANATKVETETNGHEVVTHTSRAPVVIHKIFPPYGLHKHVYAGKDGQLPARRGMTATPSSSSTAR